MSLSEVNSQNNQGNISGSWSLSHLPVDVIKNVLLPKFKPEQLIPLAFINNQFSLLCAALPSQFPRERKNFLLIAGMCSAAAQEARSLLDWYRNSLKCPWDASIAATAARSKNINNKALLNWLRGKDCPVDCEVFEALAMSGIWDITLLSGISVVNFYRFTDKINIAAARGGQLNLLKLLCPTILPRPNSLGREMCIAAAERGHLHILEWAESKGVPFNKHQTDSEFVSIDGVVEAAGEGGHLSILKWLNERKCKTFNAVKKAAEGGHLELLQWLYEDENIRRHWYPSMWLDTVIGAVDGGHLSILEWLNIEGDDLGNRINTAVALVHNYTMGLAQNLCAVAADKGRLDLLKWLRKKGCPWDGCSILNAVTKGHFEMVQWIIANGYPLNGDGESASDRRKSLCYYAALGGYKTILLYLKDNGCQWDEKTSVGAVRGGHVELLKWLKENGCPCNPDKLTFFAALHGQISLLKWLKNNEFPWSVWTSAGAGIAGNVSILKWLLENGCPIDNKSFVMTIDENQVTRYKKLDLQKKWGIEVNMNDDKARKEIEEILKSFDLNSLRCDLRPRQGFLELKV